MKNQLYILLIILLPITIYAQKPKDLAQEYIHRVLNNKSTSEILGKIIESKEDEKLLYEFMEYSLDSIGDIRRAAYRIIYKLGWKSNAPGFRKKCVSALIDGCSDKNSGIVGQLYTYLSYFNKEDFTPKVKYEISRIWYRGTPHLSMYVKLTGFLDITDLIYEFNKKIKEDEKLSFTDKWAMKIAMARMGDMESLKYIQSINKKFPIDDDYVYDVLPDLAYTQSKVLFQFMFDIILSEEKNCASSDPDNYAEIICAYRVIQIIAKYIQNFPLEVDNTGEVYLNNYEQNLITARDWIKNNYDDFKLNKNIY